MEDSQESLKPKGNPLLYGHNAFVATWAASSAAAGPISKTMARSRSTIEHKGTHEAALKDAAEAAACDFHARDDARKFEDAARCLVLPPGNVHSFANAYAMQRAAAYEVCTTTINHTGTVIEDLVNAGLRTLCRGDTDSLSCCFCCSGSGRCN